MPKIHKMVRRLIDPGGKKTVRRPSGKYKSKKKWKTLKESSLRESIGLASIYLEKEARRRKRKHRSTKHRRGRTIVLNANISDMDNIIRKARMRMFQRALSRFIT